MLKNNALDFVRMEVDAEQLLHTGYNMANAKYDWDKLFKTTKPQVLRKGKDFYGMAHGMVQQIYKVAYKRKIRVSIKVLDTDTLILVVKGK